MSIKDENIEIVLNPGNREYLITKDMILEVAGVDKITKPEFNFKELKKAKRNINKNKKLSRFVSKFPNADIDKFFKTASKSHFLTYFASQHDLSKNAEEGIIDLSDLHGNIFVVKEGGFQLTTLFTSDKFLEPTLSFYKNRGRNIYIQIVDLKTMAEFIIQNNLDGVIVDYANADMIIPRKYFEKYNRKLKKNKDYTNYAFIV